MHGMADIESLSDQSKCQHNVHYNTGDNRSSILLHTNALGSVKTPSYVCIMINNMHTGTGPNIYVYRRIHKKLIKNLICFWFLNSTRERIYSTIARREPSPKPKDTAQFVYCLVYIKIKVL